MLYKNVKKLARLHANRLALCSGQGNLNWLELADSLEKLRRLFSHVLTQMSDRRVVLLVQNRHDFVLLLLCLDSFGCELTVIDTDLISERIIAILKSVSPGLLVTDFDDDAPELRAYSGTIIKKEYWKGEPEERIVSAANDIVECTTNFCVLFECFPSVGAIGEISVPKKWFFNYLEEGRKCWLDDPDAVIGILSPVSPADIVRIVFPALYAGCTVKMISVNHPMEMKGVTHLKFCVDDVPVILQIPPAYCDTIRHIICLRDTRVLEKVWGLQSIKSQFPSCEQIIRLYSGAGMIIASHSIFPDQPLDERNLMGTPIWPGAISILDRRLKIVPADIAGDIYITYPGDDGVRINTGEKGRLLNRNTLELLKVNIDECWIDGMAVSRSALKDWILGSVLVKDANLPVSIKSSFKQQLPVFIETPNRFSHVKLQALLSDRLGQRMKRSFQLIALPDFPLDINGRIDELKLAGYRYVDERELVLLTDRLDKMEDIEEYAIFPTQNLIIENGLYPSSIFSPSGPSGLQIETEETPFQLVSGRGMDNLPPAIHHAEELRVGKDMPATLADGLIRGEKAFPEKGITLISTEGIHFISNAGLLKNSLLLLHRMQDAGLRPGDRAIIQINDMQEYFQAFWACLLGGISPLTLAVPPSYKKGYALADKLFHAWTVLENPVILACETAAKGLTEGSYLMPGLRIVASGKPEDELVPGTLHHSKPEDVAFFLLTSGSTGTPKCINISHQNAMAQLNGIRQMDHYSHRNVVVNILPIDHITPLLLLHIRSIVLCCAQIHVSTDYFISNPLVWLDALETYKGTHTFSPNFSYRLLAESIKKSPHRSWDLSSVERFTNGGEMINEKVIMEFLTAVAPFGVKEDSFNPAYGMTELAGGIIFTRLFKAKEHIHYIKKNSGDGYLQITKSDDPDKIGYFEVGVPLPGVSVRVTDRDNQPLTEGMIGSIQFTGEVVTSGYLNNPTANKNVFTADGWFITGDLGFLLDGRLTITGRVNDMVIIRGVNYYCYELEVVVNMMKGVKPGFVAAVAVVDESGLEGIALFFSPVDTGILQTTKIIKDIKIRITEGFGIEPTFVIPLKPDKFPKTDSGKVDKKMLRNKLMQGCFSELLTMLEVEKTSELSHCWKLSRRVLRDTFSSDRKLLWTGSLDIRDCVPEYFQGCSITFWKHEEGKMITDVVIVMDTSADIKFPEGLPKDAQYWLVLIMKEDHLPDGPMLLPSIQGAVHQIFSRRPATAHDVHCILDEILNRRSVEAVCFYKENRYEWIPAGLDKQFDPGGEGQHIEVCFTSRHEAPNLSSLSHWPNGASELPGRLYIGRTKKIPPDGENAIVSGWLLVDDIAANSIERILTAIWKEVLRVQRMRPRDNVFELGANSLKATQVISRIQQELRIKLELAHIFSNPTIRMLADLISQQKQDVYSPIPVLSTGNYYPLSHAQKGMWVLSQTEEEHIAYNMPVAIMIKQHLHLDAFFKAFSSLIQRHSVLRTAFINQKGEPMQYIRNDVESFKVSFSDISEDPDKWEKAMNMAKVNVMHSFDLQTDRLLRTELVKIDEEKYIFLFNIHHIIADGWAMDVLLRDFFFLYSAYRISKEPSLQPLRIQFGDYVNWQESRLTTIEMQLQRDYWLKQLKGPLPILELTAVRNIFSTNHLQGRHVLLNYKGARSDFWMDEQLTMRLRELSLQQNVTLFMLLTTFLKVLLSHLSRLEDIIIGCPVAGRGHPELEHQAGLYLNYLALRDTVKDDMIFIELLQNVKQTTLEAFTYQDYPYDLVVEGLGLKRSEFRNPLYDVMLVMDVEERDGSYLNKIPGFEDAEILDVEYPVSKLDLTFFFRVGEGLRMEIEYRTDLFSNDWVSKIGRDYVALINTWLADPLTSIRALKNNLKTSDELKERQHFEDTIMKPVEHNF